MTVSTGIHSGWRLLLLILAGGCGRLGFAPGPPGDASIPDGEGDATAQVQTQSLAVVSPEDDGEIDYGAFYPDGEPGLGLAIGFWSGKPTWGYFRFQLGDGVPAGATVVGAELALWGRTPSGFTAQHALAIQVEAALDPPPVTGVPERPDDGGRTLLASSIRWPAAGGLTWTVGDWNRSPELASLLAELVALHGGLPAGARIQLWVRGEGITVNAEVATDDLSFTTIHPATLTIRSTP